MTVVSISQPAYLPWSGYFHRIACSDVHVVLDHVQLEKGGFTHRNRIRLHDRPVWLTVPVRTGGRFGHLAIDRAELVEDPRWRAQHRGRLEHAYGRAPGFRPLREEVDAVYAHGWTHLLPLLTRLTALHHEALGISTPLVSSRGLGVRSTKSDLVLDLCRRVGATTYLSGPLGRDYLVLEDFADAGVEVRFDDYHEPEHPQRGPGFLPRLAAVDLLCGAGADAPAVLRRAGCPGARDAA